MIEKFWEFIVASCSQSSRISMCILLTTKLRIVENQIDGAKQYIEATNKSSTAFTRIIAKYFLEQLPVWIAEREGIEAMMEFNNCNKGD